MRLAVVLLISSVGVSCAEERKDSAAPGQVKKPEAAKGDKKRLQSVTWDLNAHKLVWVVQSGEPGANGDFAVKSSERYEISPDDATMGVKAEKRGFTEEEAASLHRLLDTLSLYCVESVVWWDRGEGDPIDANGQRVRKKREPTPPPAGTPEPTKVRTVISSNQYPR